MTMKGVITRYAVGGQLVRKGRGTITPPPPPSTLVATPGDTQIVLTWTPPSPATGVAHYIVKRVNADTVVSTVNVGTNTATVTGLTNDVTYNFQVYSQSSAGALSTPSNVGTAIPKVSGTTTVQTYWGMNFNSDTSFQTIAGRKARFGGRAPVIRIYGTSGLESNFSVPQANRPENRCVYSYKAGGSYSEAQLAAGTGGAQAAMQAWLLSIPSDNIVWWVYHHEPNSGTGFEVDPTNYRNTYHQMMLAYNAVKSQLDTKNVQVFITANMMAFQMDSIWANRAAWIPPRADCHVFTWDMYGNPGQNTSTTAANKYGPTSGQGGAGVLGKAYDTTYPDPSARMQMMFQITEAMGYADSWGLLEVNAPLRNWDNLEAGRAAWTQDVIDIFNAPPMAGSVPPQVALLWEAPSGANWRQQYGSNTPAGTRVAYADPANSPMWAVWAPYIQSVPLVG